MRYETLWRGQDGRQRNLLVSKSTFQDANGEPMGIVVCFMDISDFREAERATRAARDAALQSDAFQRWGLLAVVGAAGAAPTENGRLYWVNSQSIARKMMILFKRSGLVLTICRLPAGSFATLCAGMPWPACRRLRRWVCACTYFRATGK